MTTPAQAPMTEALADFVASFRPESLPEAVRETTRRLVTDGTAALVSAGNPAFSTGRIISEFVRDQGGEAVCSVVGQGFRTSVVQAVLANGTMGYASDVEPHHPEGILHPVAVMIPVALALCEAEGRSGRDMIAAVALGLEVEYRLSVALGPSEQYALGFHPSAVCGAFGAAAAASFLLGLDRARVVRAFGLAACQASGLMAWESDPTENARPFQMGMAARNGVTAAMLAGRGFGGPTEVFDHGHTVFHAFSRSPAPEKLVADLGTAWDGVMEMAIKPYSCVAFLHPALDALFDIVAETDLRPAQVERIVMRFPRDGIHCIDDNPLKSHCAQYVLPVALTNRRLRIADIFFDRREEDAELRDLCGRVSVTSDPELDPLFPDFYATKLEITTRDGQVHSRRMDIARGYPEAPMTPEELSAKFGDLAGAVLPAAEVAGLEAAAQGLWEAPDVSDYAARVGARFETQ
ncbi:MmgE/PrpD family protein [Salipiger mucosus DSM 16094]|uniref:MmgE/PrpD family protein n=2 Tax=Salipiger mucosus TaxID=263378 RepID=S9R189_9RHOB|nr:MmgE/PrpD family protein [Salipiger mucosus DSM 16094]